MEKTEQELVEIRKSRIRYHELYKYAAKETMAHTYKLSNHRLVSQIGHAKRATVSVKG